MSQKSSVICINIPSSPCQPETVTHWAAFNVLPCSSQSFSLKNSPQGKGTLLYCWWECIWCSCNGKQCGVSSKNKNSSYYMTQAVPFLGIYPEKAIHTCTSMFTAVVFTIAKTWKQPKCPLTDEWIKKMCHINTME